jgi:hypothetical protein
VFWVPLADFELAQSPDAVHELGLLVLFQVRVELPPVVIEMGLAESETTGWGGMVTVRATLFIEPLPPALVQVKE